MEVLVEACLAVFALDALAVAMPVGHLERNASGQTLRNLEAARPLTKSAFVGSKTFVKLFNFSRLGRFA